MGQIKNIINRNRKHSAYLLIAALFITGVILLWLPADYFDDGQAMCLSVLLLNKNCYGCGMTRAIQHLIHFEFDVAWAYNSFSFIVLPLFLFMSFWEIRKLLRSENKINNNDE